MPKTMTQTAEALRALAAKLDAGEWGDNDLVELGTLARESNSYQFDQAGRNLVANAMTREAFDRLRPKEQMTFIQGGGTLQDVA